MHCTTLLLVVLVVGATSCKIPKSYKPLCGVNGISYTNLKALQCHNKASPGNMIRIAYKGRCLRPDIRECNYSSVVKNVCGNDGLTYLNPAMVACKNKLQPKKQVKIISKGKCKSKTNARRRKVPNKTVRPGNVTGPKQK
ncbi:serine protease inhibitor dipetalogastin-like [Daphnia pulex]|uniref:serine protease inhibitor dipetalogastin-like n=1 Tax=Daphnia pulex TaxID=6669 RepID=UPI001EDD5B3B|nr:serine protease inhibitor dipetalogastin-like [Daphnia pulex]XP_046643766.1 serine protease inhibitor dipetalogastin-like [Daphnia pulicaria]